MNGRNKTAWSIGVLLVALSPAGHTVDGTRAGADSGGITSAREQYMGVNRIGMTDGDTYRLDFFFAERHRTQANFRITTNLPLVSLELPTVSVMHD